MYLFAQNSLPWLTRYTEYIRSVINPAEDCAVDNQMDDSTKTAEAASSLTKSAGTTGRASPTSGGQVPAATQLMSIFNESTDDIPTDPVVSNTGSEPSASTFDAAAKLMDIFKDPEMDGTVETKDLTPEPVDRDQPVGSEGNKLAAAPAGDEEVNPVAPEDSADTEAYTTEVNIKEYVLKELQLLHQGDFISQAPVITADETGKTFQVICCQLKVICAYAP